MIAPDAQATVDRPEERALARILVAVDGSPGSVAAVEQAAELAKQAGAKLCLVTVAQNQGDAQPELRELMRNGYAPYLISYLSSSAQSLLAQAREQAERCGASVESCEVRAGDAAQEILILASELAADLIVVGNRGRGALTGLLLGSVAQKLLTLATCPVMLTRV